MAVCLFFALFITACNPATESTKETQTAPAFDLATAKAEIVAANKDFSARLGKQDSTGLSNLYSQDAKFMMNGSPAIIGRPAIQHAFAGLINSGISRIDLTTVDVWGSENLVTEEGEYTLFAGEAQVDKGKYLVLWKKEEGNWHLFRDIFNSDLASQ